MNSALRAVRIRIGPFVARFLPPAFLPALVAGRVPSAPNLFVAVATLFALDGVVFGSWAARVPDVSAHVGATPASLGVALLCVSLGALATMQLTGAVSSRTGAGVVAALGALLLGITVALPGLAATVPQLCAVLLLFGAATGMVNVTANALGVTVQQRLGRPVMSVLHAGFSLGGLAGALLGGLASSAMPVEWHLLSVACLSLLVTAVIAPVLAVADRPGPSADSADSAESRDAHAAMDVDPPRSSADHREARPEQSGALRTVVLMLGAIAGCTAFAEGAVADWSALHLTQTLHAAPTLAAAGYAGFSLAMACARLGGRRLIARYGDTVLLAGGAVTAGVGLLTAGFATALLPALAGFVLVGLGLANVFPLAIARAGLLAGPRGVALASTVGYGGLLAGPPAIGLAAAHVGLPTALGALSTFAVVAASFAVVVDHRLSGATSVATVLRAQARTRLEPAAARASAAAHRHSQDLLLLTDQAPHGTGPGRPAVRAYPGLEFLAV